jgi:hypothetical protein
MIASHAQHASPDEYLQAVGTLDAAIDRVRRDAGAGTSPEHEYALLALMRRLQLFVGNDAMALVGDVRDAALRALEAANPAPALVALELAYASLRGLLDRRAGLSLRRAA